MTFAPKIFSRFLGVCPPRPIRLWVHSAGNHFKTITAEIRTEEDAKLGCHAAKTPWRRHWPVRCDVLYAARCGINENKYEGWDGEGTKNVGCADRNLTPNLTEYTF